MHKCTQKFMLLEFANYRSRKQDNGCNGPSDVCIILCQRMCREPIKAMLVGSRLKKDTHWTLKCRKTEHTVII